MFQLYRLYVCTALVLLSDDICDPNQTYVPCGSICRPYCNQEPERSDKCDALCYPGCYCMHGFIQETVDSTKCVLKGECKHLPKCGINQIFKDCELKCPISCGNLDISKCDQGCFRGCVCKDGYVRAYNSVESECIHISQCPVQDSVIFKL